MACILCTSGQFYHCVPPLFLGLVFLEVAIIISSALFYTAQGLNIFITLAPMFLEKKLVWDRIIRNYRPKDLISFMKTEEAISKQIFQKLKPHWFSIGITSFSPNPFSYFTVVRLFKIVFKIVKDFFCFFI